MVQFLISYWWILIILIIAILVITRSVLKIIITLTIVFVLFVFFWQFFITPGFTKTTKCFTVSAKSADKTYQEALTMKPGNERNQFICLADEQDYDMLLSCLKDSERENGLSFLFYSSQSKFRQSIEEIVTSHNKLCPSSPFSSPTF